MGIIIATAVNLRARKKREPHHKTSEVLLVAGLLLLAAWAASAKPFEMYVVGKSAGKYFVKFVDQPTELESGYADKESAEDMVWALNHAHEQRAAPHNFRDNMTVGEQCEDLCTDQIHIGMIQQIDDQILKQKAR